SALLEVLPSDIASEIQLVGQMPARVLVSQHKENTTNSAFQREGWAVDLDFDLAQTAFDFALYPLANFEANNNGTMRVNAFFATNEDTPTIDVKTVLAVPSSAIAADIAMQLSRLSLVSAKANVRRWAGNVFSVRYIDRPPKTDAPQPNNDEAQAAQAAQSGQEGQGEQQPSAPPESSSGAQAASNAAIPPSLQDTPTNIVLAADSTVVGLTEPQLAFMNDAPNLLSSSQRQQVYPRYEVTATTLDARPFLETETTGGILFEAFVDPFDNVFLSAEQVQVHRHLILHDVQGEILRTTPTEQTVQARARYSTESQPGRLHGWGIMTPYTDTLRIYADDFGLLTRELQFSDRYTGGTTEIIGQRHATNLHWSGFGEITDISTKDFSLLIRLQEAISIVGLWNSLASSDWNVKRVGGTFACRAEDCLVDDLRVESNSISLIASGSWSEDATDISGTIVPQTVWDNALRAIPVVGKLIVGGEDDGFLGVAFQITANESGDKVALNPLTAIEPGILRLIREGSAQSSSNNRGERASTAPSAAAQ
nr:hypothetical protein [Alphaproteobacteria bacterium]